MPTKFTEENNDHDSEEESAKSIGLSPLLIVVKDANRLLAITQTYKQLFGSHESVKVLNNSAATTFGIIQNLFYECIILFIGRLLDAKEMGKYVNLSLEKILSDFPLEGNSELMGRLNDLRESSNDVLFYRNKLFGHRDYEVAFKLFESFRDEDEDEIGFKRIGPGRLLEVTENVVRFINEMCVSLIPFYKPVVDLELEGPDGDKLIQLLSNLVRDDSQSE